MSDLRVALPEPRPEDDEDVVWGLSTANALWGRGEVQDALVWLRRAAEAAEAAGQSFRASELGMYVSEIEDRLAQEGPPPRASQRPARRSVPPPAVAAPVQVPVPRASLDMADTLTDDTITEDSGGMLAHVAMPAPPLTPASPQTPPPAAAVPPPIAPPEPARAPSRGAWADDEQTLVRKPPRSVQPPGGSAPAANPHETTLVSAKSPMQARGEPSHAPPPVPVVHHAPPVDVHAAAAQAAGSSPPPAHAPAPSAPAADPPPVVFAPPAPEPPSQSVQPAASAPAPSAATPAPASHAAPIAPHAGEAAHPAKGAAAPMTTKRRPRAPILDPWSEEPGRATSARPEDQKDGAHVAASPEPARVRELVAEDGSLVVSVRARPAAHPRAPDDDEDVVTSAMSLDMLQKRGGSGRAPPPPPKSKAAGPPASEAHPPKPPPPPVSASSQPAHEPQRRASPPPPPHAPAPTPQPGRLPAELAPVKAVAPPVAEPAVPVPEPAPIAQAPAAHSTPASVPPNTVPPERRAIGGCVLDRFDAFADLPQDVQVTLAGTGRVEQLGADEEVAGFAAAIVLEGEALVCATIVDTPAQRVATGTVVAARGSLAEGVGLRIVAGPSGARVAIWAPEALDSALRECPWVTDELRERADRLQALAGATMGPLGDLDETYRNMAVERLSVRVVAPQEQVAHAGAAIEGLMIVGAGALELVSDGGTSTGEVLPGDLVFAAALLGGLPAPTDARAAEGGAVLLVGDKKLAQELVVTIPPLLEILGG